MTKQEIEAKIAKYEGVLAKTADEKEKQTIQGVIKTLKDQLLKAEEEKPAAKEPEKEKPAEKEPEKPKKEKVKRAPKPKAKKEKKARAPKKAKAPKPEKKVEKTVKISKVVPADEKKNVKDILESEHYKVIIKEKDGKRIKITVKNSDRVVAKNKVDSAFTTIAKKVVDSEDERKKYSDDIKALDTMKTILTELIENIYKAFNSHKTDDLKSILKKLKSI